MAAYVIHQHCRPPSKDPHKPSDTFAVQPEPPCQQLTQKSRSSSEVACSEFWELSYLYFHGNPLMRWIPSQISLFPKGMPKNSHLLWTLTPEIQLLLARAKERKPPNPRARKAWAGPQSSPPGIGPKRSPLPQAVFHTEGGASSSQHHKPEKVLWALSKLYLFHLKSVPSSYSLTLLQREISLWTHSWDIC